MLDALKTRIFGNLNTTFLGAVAAGYLAFHHLLPINCQQFMVDYRVWGPAVALAVWGFLSKGPSKTDGVIATTGQIPPPIEKVK